MNRIIRKYKTFGAGFRMILMVLATLGGSAHVLAQKDSLIARFNTDTRAGSLSYRPENNCYQDFMEAGIASFQNGNYNLAARQFRAARLCLENDKAESFRADHLLEIALQIKDITTIDSLNRELARIKEQQDTNEEWEDLLATLDELTGMPRDAPPYPERATHPEALTDIRALVKTRSGKLSSTNERSQNEAVNRAHALATRANLELLRQNPDLAVDYALKARRIIDSLDMKDTLIEQTFGNAILTRDARLVQGSAQAVIEAGFSGDGLHLLTRGRDTTVHIWQVDNLENPEATIRKNSFIHAASLSRSDRLLTATADGMASLHALGETDAPEVALEGHRDQVLSACFSRDGKYILTGSRDSTVRLWDGEGTFLRSFSFEKPVYQVSFSANGSKVLAVSPGKVAVWDTLGNELGHKTMDDALFFSAHFLPRRDDLILTSSSDTITQLWSTPGNASDLLPARPLPEGALTPITQFIGENYLLTASISEVRLYEQPENPDLIFQAAVPARPTTADFADSGLTKVLLFATEDGAVQFWNVSNNTQILSVSVAPAYVTAMALAPDGKNFLLALSDNTMLFCPNPEARYEEMK